MAVARSLTMAAIVAIALASAGAHAQAVPQGKPSRVQIDNAAVVLRVITSALQADAVEQPVKTALFECVYANSVSKISEATDKVIAANAGKVDRKDASQMLAVIAGVCGYRPAAAPMKPTPKK